MAALIRFDLSEQIGAGLYLSLPTRMCFIMNIGWMAQKHGPNLDFPL